MEGLATKKEKKEGGEDEEEEEQILSAKEEEVSGTEPVSTKVTNARVMRVRDKERQK